MMRRVAILTALAVSAGACEVGLVSPASPSPVSVPQIFAEGLPLLWVPASGCSPKRPFPAVAGTAPQKTVVMDQSAARVLHPGAGLVLSAFWPISGVSEPEPNRTTQNFIVGDFVAQGGEWRVCFWEERIREQVFCDEDLCP